MVMYLCARDIDVSSFYTFSIDQVRRENGYVMIFLAHKYITILSLGLVNRKDVERGNIDISISSTQIHDHSLFCDLSSFYTFSIDQARRENGHVFVC
jgi:hypothetical protein